MISAVARARGNGLVTIRSSFRSSLRSPRAICRIRFSPLGVKGRSSSGMPGVPGSTAIPCRTM